MLIQNGELVTGTLCKKTLGASQGSLIHIIWNEEGPEAARAFLSQTQFVVNYWLLQHGMSIGIGDTVANADTMAKITNIIATVGLTPLLSDSSVSVGIVPNLFGFLLHRQGSDVQFENFAMNRAPASAAKIYGFLSRWDIWTSRQPQFSAFTTLLQKDLALGL